MLLLSSKDLSQTLNTVENRVSNPLTSHEISAVKILKEPLLTLSVKKNDTRKGGREEKKYCTNIYYLYNEVKNTESTDLPSCFLRK